jgi:hypothetical protein
VVDYRVIDIVYSLIIGPGVACGGVFTGDGGTIKVKKRLVGLLLEARI